MSQVFKLLCLAVSVWFLMQIADAESNKDGQRKPKSSSPNTYEAPFIKQLKRLGRSKAANKAKEAAAMTKNKLKKYGKEVARELNETSKKHTNDPGNLMPNFVKYHVVDPAVAVTKFSYKKAKKPFKKLASNIKETYDRADLASLSDDAIYYGTKLISKLKYIITETSEKT